MPYVTPPALVLRRYSVVLRPAVLWEASRPETLSFCWSSTARTLFYGHFRPTRAVSNTPAVNTSTTTQNAASRWSRDAFWYAGLGVGIVLTLGCFAWRHNARIAVDRAAGESEMVMRWVEESLELERDLVGMYAAVVQPPAGHREPILMNFVRAQQSTEQRLAKLRESVAGERLRADTGTLVSELDDVEADWQRFSKDLGWVIDPGPGGPPPRELIRDRLIAARQWLTNMDRALDHFCGRLRQILQETKAEAASAEHQHEQSDFLLVGLLASLVGGTSCLFVRFQNRARAEAQMREDLIRQLQAAETKYRSIFDNAIEGIFQTTPDGRFITANKALARMYGYRSPEHLMSSMSDIGSQLYVEPEQRASLLEALRDGDIVSNLEIEIVRADGRTIWIRENVRAVRNERGELLYLEGTVEDVSDRWWNEQRRRLQYATARVLERAASVAEARPMILQTVCEILDWDMGAVWDVNAGSTSLECVEVWHSPHIDITEFEEAVSRARHGIGEGLAGEVWESGEPKWIANLETGAHTAGARIAVKHGMGSAFGVPIKVAGEVRHVVEFFSPKISLPDPELLQTLGLIANQLGHLIERKISEEALRKSDMRKAAILRSALDSIISFDLDGRIVEFNPAAERAFGIQQSAALGGDVVGLFALSELQMTHRRGIALYNATNVAPGNGQRVELNAVHTDGREFPVEVAVSRINIDGTPMFTAFLRDISERKQAERLTSELAAVVANSNDAIIGCTIEGTIRSWNVGAERIYGWSAEEMIGSSLEVLLPPERRDEYPRTLATVREGDSLANYETQRLRKDGKKISVSITESPIRSESGVVTGLSSIARDITERKRLEEELLQSQKMDAVGRLAGGIAHDFNNVLTAILGYSDLLIGQIEPKHWMYRHLSEIRKAADFAAALTHQLLAFSRRQPLYLRVFAINDTVKHMQKMLQRVIGEQIKIRTELGAEIGRLKADPSQLEQVLLNLCVNARDAMPHGGLITISTADVTYVPSAEESSLSEMPAGEYVMLTVADTGTGIPADVIKHIFEPFFTTKDHGQGTGLGLATCYGIVKQSGGFITVDSTVGVGTTFRIYLPRVDESGEKATTRQGLGNLPRGCETVLYVEDEVAVRSLTAHVLRKLGYNVLEAGDAQQAKRVVEGYAGPSITLMFSDVVLPDAGGRELAEWLLGRHPRARLLFTSGYVDDGVLKQHGIDSTSAFLQKPFTPSDLACKLRDVIDCVQTESESLGLSRVDGTRGSLELPLSSAAN